MSDTANSRTEDKLGQTGKALKAYIESMEMNSNDLAGFVKLIMESERPEGVLPNLDEGMREQIIMLVKELQVEEMDNDPEAFVKFMVEHVDGFDLDAEYNKDQG
ncbi:MAG: hypothetical protein ACLFP8_08765 [Alphaproteobacteria bacterium]